MKVVPVYIKLNMFLIHCQSYLYTLGADATLTSALNHVVELIRLCQCQKHLSYGSSRGRLYGRTAVLHLTGWTGLPNKLTTEFLQ